MFGQIHQNVIEHREVSTEISKNVENNSTESTNNNTNKVHILSLPYKGGEAKELMKSLNNTLVNVLPEGHTTKIVLVERNWHPILILKIKQKYSIKII